MTEALLDCTLCDEEIAVDMDAAILRMDMEPRADAELLFVGVQPLRLSEPTLDAAYRAPPAGR